MSIADKEDMVAVRKLYNSQAGVYQVTELWDPANRGDVTFVQRGRDRELLAFLVAGLSPHPVDGLKEPEMKMWYSNPDASPTESGKALWAVALEMAQHYQRLGHHRTFGRTIGGAALAAEAQHAGFSLVEGREGRESYVVADDRQETMDFLASRSAVTA